VHFRWLSSRARQAQLAGVLSSLLVAAPAVLRAEPRRAIDFEPVTPYFSTGDLARTEISVLGFTYGNRFGSFVTYFGGGAGFFTVQARGGVTWLPGDLDDSGLMVRLEARPQILLNPCFEPLLVGSLGVGFRWPLERGDPGYPGTAIYLLPAFTGGVGFLHENCGKPTQTALRTTGLFGGTLSGGFDW